MSRLARFLSTEQSFPLPLGSRIGENAVRGYYIDMSAKAEDPVLLPRWERSTGEVLWVAIAQWALGCHERYLETGDEQWLAGMRAGGETLVRNMRDDGGIWHTTGLGHTFPLRPPWLSAMAQGEAASLLVRLHLETGEDRYAEAAVRATAPLYVDSSEGGTRAYLDGGPWLEEYPTDPPSFVLNGGIFAMWGLYDVALGLGDARARSEWDACIATFHANVHRWDTGRWSRYDLFPHPFMANVGSLAYHALHTNQLRAMQRIAPDDRVAAVLARFEQYASSPWLRRRAFAAKSAFRVAVPRNRRLARIWPGPMRQALRAA